MKELDVKIGQVWRRADGREVKLTAERMSGTLRELELTPLGKGRTAWKWDAAIIYDLTFVSGTEAQP